MNSQNVDQELSRVSKNTLIYSVGNIGVKSVTFLLIPLYTRYLSTYEVGIIILLELLEVLYNYVAPLGMLNSLWRFFNVEKSSGNEKRLIFSHFFFILISNAVLLIFLIPLSRLVAQYYLSDASFTKLLQLFFVALFLGLARVFILTLLRIIEKALLFTVVVLIDFVLLIGLTIWFVVGFKLGLWGVIYAKLIASTLIFIIAVVHVIKSYRVHFYFANVKRSLRYGFPLIFHGIGLLILTMSDRLIIKQLISTEASGIYGIAYKFGMILNMVLVTPFVQAWQPIMFRLENAPDQKITYQKIALHFTQIGILVWLMVSVLSRYLLQVSTVEAYHSAYIIIPWIAFSYLLYGLQNVFKSGALLHLKSLQMTGFSLITAAMNILLNFLLIPAWGILGAAIATIVSYLFLMLLVLRLSQKVLFINWRWHKMLATVFLGVGVFSLSLVRIHHTYLNFAKDFGLILLLPVAMILLKLISLKEIKRQVVNFVHGAP